MWRGSPGRLRPSSNHSHRVANGFFSPSRDDVAPTPAASVACAVSPPGVMVLAMTTVGAASPRRNVQKAAAAEIFQAQTDGGRSVALRRVGRGALSCAPCHQVPSSPVRRPSKAVSNHVKWWRPLVSARARVFSPPWELRERPSAGAVLCGGVPVSGLGRTSCRSFLRNTSCSRLLALPGR